MYAVLFLGLAIAALCYLITSSNLFSWLLIYPALNCILLSIAYCFNKPEMVLGKNKAGKINPVLLSINLPWLLLTWTVWLLESWVSREHKINKIGQTNIYLGRYPRSTKTKDFDLVIDLTAEFPPWKAAAKEYICLPNLDGIQLRNTERSPQLSTNQKILIHCAQGHGRSATYASLLISQLFLTISPQEALFIVLKSRPGARPSKAQLSQVSTTTLM